MKLLHIVMASMALTLATSACANKKGESSASGSQTAPRLAPSASPSAAVSGPGPATSGSSATSSAAPANGAKAEVEIVGSVGSKVPAARFKIFVSPKPCAELGGVMGEATTRNQPGDFFLEIFVPQGSQGYICGAALDQKGQVVAVGGYSGNPVTMRGVGEVSFNGVSLLLEPLAKPVAAPPGL